MAKFNPKTLQNLDNPPTAVAVINYNFDALKLLADTLLSRDGKTPNTMQSFLDMNNYRILNLPVPVSPTEPARHGDIQQYVDLAKGYAEDSEQSAIESAESAAEAHADLVEFQESYLGTYPDDPVIDKNGQPIQDGAVYWNSTIGALRVYSVQRVHVGLDPVFVGSNPVYSDIWITLPVPFFEDLDDVDISAATNGAWLVWTGNQVVGVTPVAAYVSQDNPLYTGSSVQDALDDLTTRTSLGVYDIMFWVEGLMENSEMLFRLVTSRTFWFPVSGTGSIANSINAAQDNTVISLQKNGDQFGTITFAPSSKNGVFSIPSETTFNSGDILTLHAPLQADTALRHTSFTLACRR